MKKMLLLLFLFSGLFYTANAQTQNLEELLFELPDVIFKEIESTNNYGPTYQLKIKQPLDHYDKSKGYFYQKVYLSHKGFDRPTVMNTAGYARNNTKIFEITELLKANQIDVEHRFSGESIPDSLDYNYLNLKQSTADLHHINTLLKKVYKGKWVSTGISKGGVTTIFYKYFYPDDFDVGVSYVAPLNTDYEDKRIYTFLDTVGSDECRENIKSFQIRLLENREKVLQLLKFYSIGKDLKFSYLTLDQAFEFAILDYPFTFWQWGYSCDEIPDENISLDEAIEYFVSNDPLSLFSNSDMDYFGSHYYQSATEMGYYGYEIKNFKNLVKALPTNTNPHATFLPNKMIVDFDNTLLKKVHRWIKNDGNKFIFIYGALDTWSACAIQPSKKVDSKWFFLKGKHHGNARIKEMNEEELEELIFTLEKWLSIDIEETYP